MNTLPPELAAAVGAVDPWALIASFLADSPYPLQACSPQGQSLYVNDAFRRLFGSAPPPDSNVIESSMLGRTGLAERLRPAFRGQSVELPPFWHSPPAGERTPHGEAHRLYLRLRASAICDGEGQVVFVVLQYEDLTNQRRAIEERERLLAERDAVLRQSPIGIILCDPGGRFRLVNQAAARIWGGSPPVSSRADWPVYRTFDQDGAPLPPERWPLARALAGEVVEAEEIGFQRFDGSRGSLLVGAAPLRDAEGHDLGAVMTLTDATRFRELERLRDQFISVAAHELRTPLTTLLGYSQLLARRLKTGAVREQLDASAENIVRAGRRLDVLVNQLIDVSRLERGSLLLQRRPCDLARIARGAIEDLSFRYPTTSIRVEASASVEGEWDGGRLEQALLNLLDNAVKYGQAGGPVTLRLEDTPTAATVSVENEGGAVDEAELARLFDRYYRAQFHEQGPTPGMGLGLYMAREVVLAHGGNIGARNRPGGGLVVSFTLPKEPAEERA